MAVLNLKIARDKYAPLIRDPDKTNLKLGDIVSIRNHTPKTLLIPNIDPGLEFVRKFQTMLLMYKTVLERSGECQYNIYNYHTLAEHMLTNLPDIPSFRHKTKYINHPNLMPDLSTTI